MRLLADFKPDSSPHPCLPRQLLDKELTFRILCLLTLKDRLNCVIEARVPKTTLCCVSDILCCCSESHRPHRLTLQRGPFPRHRDTGLQGMAQPPHRAFPLAHDQRVELPERLFARDHIHGLGPPCIPHPWAAVSDLIQRNNQRPLHLRREGAGELIHRASISGRQRARRALRQARSLSHLRCPTSKSHTACRPFNSLLYTNGLRACAGDQRQHLQGYPQGAHWHHPLEPQRKETRRFCPR